MQRFTFHQQAERLRGHVFMWRVIVLVDSVSIVVVAFFIDKPFNYLVFAFALLWLAFLWWVAKIPLRRQHSLTETTLRLVTGYTTAFAIPRDQIKSAERFTARLPQGVAPVDTKYVPRDDTLYILPDKHHLVAIALNSPVRGKLPTGRMAEFTRVVCMVDEPEAFIAAVSPGTGPTLAVVGSTDETVATAASPVNGGQQAATIGMPNANSDLGPAAIELCQLTRRFGEHTAVNELTLRVAPGEIFAFLGSNGAGKSTTIKMMVGLLRPTSGQILIGGKDPWKELNARRQVGYVPDIPMLYENLTAQEHLWLVGGLYHLAETEARARALELLHQLGLARYADQQVRSFSLGMKRKLAIASALMHRPPVLLLDEATNGLDPRAAREIKNFITDAARSGTTIFLTTHLLDVVGELAHRVAIIDQGELQALGTLPELQRAAGRPDSSLEELFLLLTDRSGKGASA